MVSLKIKYFFYGSLVSISLITLMAEAAGTDGVFGDYFKNMINDIGTCTSSDVVVTGFVVSGPNYATKQCTTFQNIVKQALKGYGLAPSGQAVIGFDANGNPKFGDVNWIRSGTDIHYPVGGNVGIGTQNPTKTLSVSGVVTADQYCITGTNECVKTFQQTLSNTQYYNFMNSNDYGGPGGTTNLLYTDSSFASTNIAPQGPVYMNVNSAMISAVGIDPSYQNRSNWFPIAKSYMQAFEPYPRSLFVDQGDDMSVIIDSTVYGPVAGGTNVLYCWIRRNSDGYETATNTCDSAPAGWTIFKSEMSNPAKNHGGMLTIEYKLITGSHRECDTINWSSIMQNVNWGNPETTNIKSTTYQSAPNSTTYPNDYCGFDNMHSQIVARFHLIDKNTVTAGSLLQFATDSPRTIKLKSIGISLLK